MLKRTITYENPFTNKMVSEEYYFHISKADLIEMQMENMNEPPVKNPETGQMLEGFPAKLQRIINDQDGTEILVVVKDMIKRSYGRKDGDRFIRASTNPEVWTDFISTEAYSQLYYELCTDAVAQGDFMNGIFPSDMLAEVNKLAAAQAEKETTEAQVEPKAETNPALSTNNSTPRVLTTQEVAEMNSDELKSGLATGRYKLS